jgi:DNA-binding NarL/FixJ family response regulator
MSANFDFLTAADKPALLGLSTPEWQELARAALNELGYKVHMAATHGDFIGNFTQVAYQVVIIEECFAADNAPENRSLEYLRSLQMQLRRHATVILVGDHFTSFNPMEAFQNGVHLVVNRSEMLLLIQFIQKAVADNELFLHSFRETQRRVAHGLAKV